MLRPLTALRFPAALAVFLWHAPFTKPFAEPLSLGYLGVGFFFLLSGFILTYTYRGAYHVRDFYVARIARVFPVHLLGMLLATATLLWIGGEHWSELPPDERALGFIAQVPLLQSWFSSPAIHFGINGPSWSLSVEAWFYAIFPLLALGFRRLFGRATERRVLAAAGALCVCVFALIFCVHVPFNQWAVYVFPPSRTGDFALGMLLGIAYLRRTASATKIDPTILEICAVAGLGVGVFITAAAPAPAHFYAAMMPFSAFAIYIFALGGGALSRALSHRIPVLLGEASYAFYVIHFWIVHLIANFALALGVTVLLCLLIFRYVETPLRRTIRERFAPRTPSTRPPARPLVPAAFLAE